MPVSLGGTIALIAAAPGLAQVYAWVAAIGIPLLAVPSIVALLTRRRRDRPLGTPWMWTIALACAVALLLVAWTVHAGLLSQAAAVALTALSTTTLAAYLAVVTPVPWLKVGVLTLAALDAVLVSAQLLQGPNDTLNAATPGAGLPHLQVAVFGSVMVGYGDLFIAAVLGNIIVADARFSRLVQPWQGAVLVLCLAAAFDALFLVVDVLPATVPVAVALLVLEAWTRRSGAQGGTRIRRARRSSVLARR
jgi:hypothetical protein